MGLRVEPVWNIGSIAKSEGLCVTAMQSEVRA